MNKEQEITSLSHRLQTLESQNEGLEGKLGELKQGNLAGESSAKDAENLLRKIQVLENELDIAEKNVKETMEKCVLLLFITFSFNSRTVLHVASG